MGQLDSGNAAWILTSASLVFLMTPGVAFFYGGMVRAKAVLNMMIMEAAALSVTMIMWVLWGWSIAYAGTSVGGIFGDPATGFLLKDTMVSDKGVFTSAALNGNNYPVSVDVAFQSAFAMITVALICGAIAERVKYSTWMIFVALWITFDYAPLAHMVWNGGLLSADGAISQAIGAAAHDFAGGTVVHINAAVAALVIVLIIGKRKGFGTQPFRPHNVPFVMLGAFLLWFGWFGFNAGSAFAANGTAGYAWVSTSAATAAAMLSWGFTEKIRTGHYTAMGAASGIVAGLVAITPAADVVSPLWAIVLGAIAGVLTCLACGLKFKLGYDDSLASSASTALAASPAPCSSASSAKAPACSQAATGGSWSSSSSSLSWPSSGPPSSPASSPSLWRRRSAGASPKPRKSAASILPTRANVLTILLVPPAPSSRR